MALRVAERGTMRSTPAFAMSRLVCSSPLQTNHKRSLSSSSRRLSAGTSPSIATNTSTLSEAPSSPSHKEGIAENELSPVIYSGPLTTTFRRLKIFSLSSCGLTVAFIPFLLTLESSLPFIAQATLSGTVLASTFVSTALVGWTAGPYVTTMRRTADGAGLQMSTASMLLRPRATTVYDPAFLAPSRRPFAAWQLAPSVRMPASNAPIAGSEETVAETRDEKGEVIGRWIVTWGEGGEGTCRESGKVLK
jgi:hypothetical protein